MKPPKCPECGEPLDEIIRARYGEGLDWDPEAGHYVEDDAQTQISYICPHCQKGIGGWRADGEHWGFLPEEE